MTPTTAQITVDGATVYCTKTDGKLVVSIDDPGCTLAEVGLTEHASGRSLAKAKDPTAEARALKAVEPLSRAINDQDRSAGIRSAIHGATSVDAYEALLVLRLAARAAGLTSYWPSITSQAGQVLIPSCLSNAHRDWAPFLALAYRDLIGSHGFTAEHYAALTSGWRAVVGPVHPDDDPLMI